MNDVSKQTGLPPDFHKIFGKTGKYQKTRILVRYENTYFVLGWMRFASDGGFYCQVNFNGPATATGNAVAKDGLVQLKTEKDITSLPTNIRSNPHLSLHPSGEVHMRSGTNECITRKNIGSWMPLQKPAMLAHIFTPRIGDLPKAKSKKDMDRSCRVNSLDAALRLDIKLLPQDTIPESNVVALGGISPRYNILVEFTAISVGWQGIMWASNI